MQSSNDIENGREAGVMMRSMKLKTSSQLEVARARADSCAASAVAQ